MEDLKVNFRNKPILSLLELKIFPQSSKAKHWFKRSLYELKAQKRLNWFAETSLSKSRSLVPGERLSLSS